MRKRILVLANNSGGLYRFRKELLGEIINQGYEVIASTPFDENVDDLKKLGVSLIETKMDRRGMNPIKDFNLLLDYFKLVKIFKPQLIITYTIKPNLYGCTIARLTKVPYAINITGLGTAFQNNGMLNKLVTIWYSFVCKRVKIIFFENEENKNVFVENNIVIENKCCVLNGAGVNILDFSYEEYPKDESIIHFLFIGRIMKEKGVEELFCAVEKLYEESNHIVLDVLGNYEDNYREVIDSLTKRGIVNYYGYQSDVRPFIKQCHCFVLPSYHEGMANTNLESAAMGRPVITSDIPGCREAIVDNTSGYLCKKKDTNDLYKVMKRFIKLTHDEKRKMGILGRKRMESIFDKKKVIEKTMKELEV